jgi:hypothetical protein
MKFGIREIVFVAAMFGLLAASYFLVFKKANDERVMRKFQIEMTLNPNAEVTEDAQATAGSGDQPAMNGAGAGANATAGGADALKPQN